MKQITNKFRYGMIAGAIALVLPLVANSALWDCQDDRADLRQPGTLAMQNMQNEMLMHMRQGMPPLPQVGMMPPPPFQINGDFIPPLPPVLNLSELQRDKIFELLHSQEPVMRAQEKAVRKAMAEMNQLAAADHYSVAEVRLLADKLASAIADTILLRTETGAKIRSFLTPEQRKQADEMRARCEADSGHEEHSLK